MSFLFFEKVSILKSYLCCRKPCYFFFKKGTSIYYMKYLLPLIYIIMVVTNSFSQGNEIGIRYIKAAKEKCDSAIILLLGNKLFGENVIWNKENSYVICETPKGNKQFSFSENFNGVPVKYNLDYYVVLKNDTLLRFDMLSDSIVDFSLTETSYWNHTLIGYKKLILGEFTISKTQALAIGKKKGVSGTRAKVQLNFDEFNDHKYNASGYYWEVYAEYEKKSIYVHIDPNSGKVLNYYENGEAVE